MLFFRLFEKKKKKFQSTFEKKILFVYFKRNDGWLCLQAHSFQKKCVSQCWVYRFLWEMEFAIAKNQFLTLVERYAIVDRLVKKYQKSFSKERINNLNDDRGKNWKLCLLNYKLDPFTF